MPSSEQGVTRERYMLVPRTLIFVTRGDEVLLLRGAPDKRLWAGLYNGVGGHVEDGEDVLSAALRELREETGITGIELRLCGVVTVDTGVNPGVCVFVYSGTYTGDETGKSGEGSLEWVRMSRLGTLPLVSDLPYLLPRVFDVKPGMPPFAAHSSYNEAGNLVITFK